MNKHGDVFERVEKKYVINKAQFDFIMDKLAKRTIPDAHGESLISNIYFDTPDYRLIRRSLLKPVYKEKLRLRGYGAIDEGSELFLEIKKKYDGVVYKRRIELMCAEAADYLKLGGKLPERSQIAREIEWFMGYYPMLAPRMYISYDRIALYDKEDHDLRITFDTDITWRSCDLDLTLGSYGDCLTADGEYVMEIKLSHSMPLWLSEIMTKARAYNASYSKYGCAFIEMQRRAKSEDETIKISDGGIYCA